MMNVINNLTDYSQIDRYDPSTWVSLKQVRQHIRDVLFDMSDQLDPLEVQDLEMQLDDVEQRISRGELYEFPY